MSQIHQVYSDNQCYCFRLLSEQVAPGWTGNRSLLFPPTKDSMASSSIEPLRQNKQGWRYEPRGTSDVVRLLRTCPAFITVWEETPCAVGWTTGGKKRGWRSFKEGKLEEEVVLEWNKCNERVKKMGKWRGNPTKRERVRWREDWRWRDKESQSPACD